MSELLSALDAHTKVHHGFSVVRQPDGRWRSYRPDGTEILIHPLLI